MKLTKLQKHTVYIIMKEEIENNMESRIVLDGYCYLLFHLFEGKYARHIFWCFGLLRDLETILTCMVSKAQAD